MSGVDTSGKTKRRTRLNRFGAKEQYHLLKATIPDLPPFSQWQIAWDAFAGGWRGSVEGWRTGAYNGWDGVAAAVERGWVEAVSAQAETPASEASEGLVSCQQSLDAPPAPMPGTEAKASEWLEPEETEDEAAGRRKYSPGRRWRITLSDGEKTSVLDSLWARMGRCHKRVKAWANAMPQLNRRLRRMYKRLGIGPRLVMLTLTYGDEAGEYQKSEGWEPNHIREFMLKLRKVLGAKLWAYAWVAEMQERGTPHYHVLVYVAPGTDVPAPDTSGLWSHGCTERKTAKKPWYIVKYAGKEYQKEGLPYGARMFAVWIGKKQATDEELLGFRLSAAPPYVQDAIREYYQQGIVGAAVRWARQVGGGWIIKDLGEVLLSVWYLVSLTEIEPDGGGGEGAYSP